MTEVTEIVEPGMSKVAERSKAEVVETIAHRFENAAQSSYLNSNEGLKLYMLNNVEHALKEVVCAGRSCGFYKL